VLDELVVVFLEFHIKGDRLFFESFQTNKIPVLREHEIVSSYSVSESDSIHIFHFFSICSNTGIVIDHFLNLLLVEPWGLVDSLVNLSVVELHNSLNVNPFFDFTSQISVSWFRNGFITKSYELLFRLWLVSRHICLDFFEINFSHLIWIEILLFNVLEVLFRQLRFSIVEINIWSIPFFQGKHVCVSWCLAIILESQPPVWFFLAKAVLV